MSSSGRSPWTRFVTTFKAWLHTGLHRPHKSILPHLSLAGAPSRAVSAPLRSRPPATGLRCEEETSQPWSPTMNRDEPSNLPAAEEPASGVPRMVPGHKWIRAVVDGQVVVDARAITFVWEIPYWPTWFFRPEDLTGELRESNGAPRQGSDLAGARRCDFHAAGKVLAGARGATRPRCRKRDRSQVWSASTTKNSTSTSTASANHDPTLTLPDLACYTPNP